MFLHSLSEEEKTVFLEVAELICQADNRILWNGKTEDEITGDDIASAAFEEDASELEVLKGLTRECGRELRGNHQWIKVETRNGPKSLLNAVRGLPLLKQNDPEARKAVACEQLTARVKNLKPELPATPRVMLFEFMLLCLADGSISDIELCLLQTFSERLAVDIAVFEELHERAVATHEAVQKAMAIILE